MENLTNYELAEIICNSIPEESRPTPQSFIEFLESLSVSTQAA